MTADEIRDYTGNIFRASLVTVRKNTPGAEKCPHDLESPTVTDLHAKVSHFARDHHIVSFQYGVHTTNKGRNLIDIDGNVLAMRAAAHTGESL